MCLFLLLSSSSSSFAPKAIVISYTLFRIKYVFYILFFHIFFYGHRKITQNDVLTRDTTVVVKMCLLLFMLSDSYEILSLFCCLFGARSMTFDVKCVHSTQKYVANSSY